MTMVIFQMAYFTYASAEWQMVSQFGMVKAEKVGYE
jgi:hypothetical protein